MTNRSANRLAWSILKSCLGRIREISEFTISYTKFSDNKNSKDIILRSLVENHGTVTTTFKTKSSWELKARSVKLLRRVDDDTCCMLSPLTR